MPGFLASNPVLLPMNGAASEIVSNARTTLG